MRIFRAFSNFPAMPSFDAMDAGSGGGAAGGQGGQQQGGGQGIGGGAGASGTPGGGSGSPVSLADDTQITHEGKTMSWKDYRTNNFVPKSEFDNVRNLTRQEIETNLRKLATQLAQQKQPQQQPQQRVDPFAKVRGVPIVDGDTLAAVAEAGFGQVAQTIHQQQQRMQQMEAQLKKISGGVATLGKERSSVERTSRISQALTSLGEGYDVKDPFLNEIAQDVLDAWEFDKPEEFPAMVQQRIAAAEKFFRARDKQQLAAAKTRRFVRPGGSGTPSGAARFDHKNAATQAADMLFGVRGANT